MTKKITPLVFSWTILASACCSVPKPQPPPVTPIPVVVDKIKGEIRYVLDNLPQLERTAESGDQCHNKEGKVLVKVTPDSAKLTLKTVKTRENDPTAGLVNGIGVLSIGPTYSGAYSKSASQSVELDLSIPPPEKERPVGVPAGKELSFGPETREKHVRDVEAFPIGTTVIEFAEELLRVDHSKTPCVLPTSLKVITTFDVVNKTSGGVTINLYVFKLGDTISATNEAHQNLEMDFDLTGSSPAGPPEKPPEEKPVVPKPKHDGKP